METRTQLIERLREELHENADLLADCMQEEDVRGVVAQRRAIRRLMHGVDELMLPGEDEKKRKGERYGWDYY